MTPPATPAPSATADIIAIHIGPKSKRTSFSAERLVLMSKSSYFRNLLSDREVREVEWQEVDPVIFEGMLEWMKEGTLGPLAIPSIGEGCPKLLAAYRDASAINLCGFKNEIADHIRTTLRNGNAWPSTGLISSAYGKGVRHEPVTKLIMRCLVWQLRNNPQKFITENDELFPDLVKRPEIMQDLGAELQAFAQSPSAYPCEETTQEQICEYHDHSDGSKCAGLGLRTIDIEPPRYSNDD